MANNQVSEQEYEKAKQIVNQYERENSEQTECPGCGAPVTITFGTEWITCGICGHDDLNR